jgi:hypothetical protein
MKPRAPRSKTMRVATALTGMTACGGAFLPTTAAHAATSAGHPGNLAKAQTGEKLVRLKVSPVGISPDVRTIRPVITADPTQPYWLNILFAASVTKYQVCGYHPNGYACTPLHSISKQPVAYSIRHAGGNKYSWDLGQITVGWNGGGPGHHDSCNTTGHWHGSWQPGSSLHESAYLTSTFGGPIGNGVPEC